MFALCLSCLFVHITKNSGIRKLFAQPFLVMSRSKVSMSDYRFLMTGGTAMEDKSISAQVVLGPSIIISAC